MRTRRIVLVAFIVIVGILFLFLVPVPFYHQGFDSCSPSNADCQFGVYYSVTSQYCFGYGSQLSGDSFGIFSEHWFRGACYGRLVWATTP